MGEVLYGDEISPAIIDLTMLLFFFNMLPRPVWYGSMNNYISHGFAIRLCLLNKSFAAAADGHIILFYTTFFCFHSSIIA